MPSSAQDLPVSGSDVRSEIDGLNSSESSSSRARTVSTAPNKPVRVRHRFSSWSFHFTFSADSTALNGGRATGCVTVRDRQTFLHAHIKSRLEYTMPAFVAFITAFYDTSFISGDIADGISICISLRGYVQTRTNTCCEINTVQKWIPSALWKPVRGGLASDSEFRADITRSEDPNDQWTQMIVLGSLCLNNAARSEKKQMREAEAQVAQAAKRQALGDVTNRPQGTPSRPASDTSSSRGSPSTESSSSVRAHFSRPFLAR